MAMKKIIVADVLKRLIERDRSILDRAGFNVFVASSNDEVLRLHKAVKVDLIITMLIMPGMDGEELCSVIRREREICDVSIILVSSVRNSEVEKCARAKTSATMTLPLDLDDLARKIDTFLNVPRRETFRVLLSVKVEGKIIDQSFMCTSVNISASGLLLETERPLSQGDRLECSFFLPGAKRLIIRGEVMRLVKKPGTPTQYGIKFQDVSKDAAESIETFVKNKMERH